MGKASADFPDSVDFAASSHQHIGRDRQTSKATLRALVSPNGTLVAALNNDHEVNVAVFIGRAPRVRSEKINLFRLKLGFQPLKGFFQKSGLICLHGVKINIVPADFKARVCRIWPRV
jgi:hypothetical protein